MGSMRGEIFELEEELREMEVRYARLREAAEQTHDAYWPEFEAALKGLSPERRAKYMNGPLGRLHAALEAVR